MRMPSLLAVVLTVSVVLNRGEVLEAAPTHQSGQCRDWGVARVGGVVRVYQGEVGRVGCPVFHNLSVSNYSLFWYRLQPDHALGQPVNLSLPDHRISTESEWLWFQPALAQDAGRYVCTLRRNGTGTVEAAVLLEVLPRPSEGCVTEAAADPLPAKVPLDEHRTLHCPDIHEYGLSHKLLSVAWFHKCTAIPDLIIDREVKKNTLIIHAMLEMYEGNYTCVVTYQSGGRTLSFTRVITVKAVSSSRLDRKPVIHNPDEDQVYPVKLGAVARLDCRAFVYDAEGHPEVWWEIDGRRLEQLTDERITDEASCEEDSLLDRTMKSVLVIQKFRSQDLRRDYTCHARNDRGNATRRAVLQLEAYVPSVELGCGLGAVLLLTLVLFAVYRVFRLELLLLYRAYCGPDESAADEKEYDVYISYARNSEEEQFVLMTLRRVLENELGYRVFIFDRDSLPGGTITDETLSFLGRSRCLLAVVSPRYVLQGTQALLELKAGLDSMARAGHLRVILLQYQPVARDSWVRELRRARVALALIRWKGQKSADLSSRFWKQLQLELPVRRRRRKKSMLSEDCAALPLTPLTQRNTQPLTTHIHTENTHPLTTHTHTLRTHSL